MGTFVRIYKSTDAGAPSLANVAGQFISLLDAVLVNGYNSHPLDSITRVSTTATATHAAHGFINDDVVNHSGAGEAEYNGDFRIFNVTANTYDFTVTGTPATPATGTVTTKKASVGWTKPFTGTNLAAFRQGAGNQMYMRVNDANTTYVTNITAYEVMTDINTGTGQFVTGATSTGPKSDGATARQWVIAATDRHLFVHVNTTGLSDANGAAAIWFGDIKSIKVGDAFGTMLSTCGSVTPGTMNRLHEVSTTIGGSSLTNCEFPRAYTQIGGAIGVCRISDYSIAGSSSMGAGGLTYPHPVDGGLYIAPLRLNEAGTTRVRGVMPGVWNPLHARPLTYLAVVDGAGEYLGKKFMALNMYSGGQVLLEISDTWDWVSA